MLPPATARFGWLLLTSLVLLFGGLYNGFPLVTYDTGTYLGSGLTLSVPDDRPLTYGLFMRVASLQFSLWLVVFFQCLLLAGLLLRYLEVYVPRARHPATRLALLLAFGWATGLSWISCELMPDIFTAIGLLALGLVLLGHARSQWRRAGLLLLALVSAMMHSSNVLTFSLVVSGFGALAAGRGWFRRGWLRPAYWRQSLAAVLAAWLVLPAMHRAFGGEFAISRAAPAFLMGRLCETGILERFLDDHCGWNQAYSLCAYRDRLPNDASSFMWSPDSPMNQTGGWNAHLAEYRGIIGQVLRTPRYYPSLAAEAAQATLRQLTHALHGNGAPPACGVDTPPYSQVQVFNHGYELKEYMTSLQNQSRLDFTALNERLPWVYVLALLVVLAGLARPGVRRRVGPAGGMLLVLVGVALVANAFVTGSLANVLDRLQVRMAWLLPFAALLLAAEHGPAVLLAGLRLLRRGRQLAKN
ncbi:hypothetical protein AUC43_10900 [Hymenobacter sedentarius]|uniref:Glycosyltransferase RgtA/B/C/D-like domain-containing protein n=1 Tax=Hymenobacter sedentarius TaxID=1411621 RepID=A0A0U4C3C5_9BACT|nr:hypothetical protein [Hymenobacter sedentarius]ALW85554.1 hypothetical protein AUC43_10900 [Hymenobacter sedentarius]